MKIVLLRIENIDTSSSAECDQENLMNQFLIFDSFLNKTLLRSVLDEWIQFLRKQFLFINDN